jgi:hypothetical protein
VQLSADRQIEFPNVVIEPLPVEFRVEPRLREQILAIGQAREIEFLRQHEDLL